MCIAELGLFRLSDPPAMQRFLLPNIAVDALFLIEGCGYRQALEKWNTEVFRGCFRAITFRRPASPHEPTRLDAPPSRSP